MDTYLNQINNLQLSCQSLIMLKIMVYCLFLILMSFHNLLFLKNLFPIQGTTTMDSHEMILLSPLSAIPLWENPIPFMKKKSLQCAFSFCTKLFSLSFEPPSIKFFVPLWFFYVRYKKVLMIYDSIYIR